MLRVCHLRSQARSIVMIKALQAVLFFNYFTHRKRLKMKVLHICSEMYPLIKTGGLADVMGALPFAQQQAGNDVRVLIPYYPKVAQTLGNGRSCYYRHFCRNSLCSICLF